MTVSDFSDTELFEELIGRLERYNTNFLEGKRTEATQVGQLMTEIDTLQRENMDLIQQLENLKGGLVK